MRLSAARRAAALTVCITLAYTQLPLYSSTQNTYFLHGLAHSGFGHLAHDWLARTTDPVPVFSALVRVTSGWLWAPCFHLYACALFGAYLLGLLAIASIALDIRSSSRTEWILAAVLIALHSGLLGFASLRAVGANLPQLFGHGLANQYLLGAFLQPSSFGILLIPGVVAAARGRHALAIVLAALAATFHPTYLLIAAVFSLTVVGVLLRSGRRDWSALKMGALAVVLLSPIAAYVALNFRSGPPGVNADALAILVKVRLPHHADIGQWFGAGSVFQILLMCCGLVLARGTPVFPFLLWPFVVGAALTLVEVLTWEPHLALLFPWRFSVVLVPVSTTLLAGRLLLWVRDRLPSGWLAQTRFADASVAAALGFLALSGLAGTALRFRSAVAPGTAALMDFVRANGGAEDLCLIPASMEGFRIGTGVPVFVDEKNHPFRDVDVVEWYRRILWSRRVRAAGPDSISRVVRDLLERYPVSIVVAEPQDSAFARCDVLTRWHEVGGFTLYRVHEPPVPAGSPAAGASAPVDALAATARVARGGLAGSGSGKLESSGLHHTP